MKTAPNMLYYRSRYLFSVQLKTILSKPGFKKLVKHHNLVNVKTYLQLLKAFRLIRDAFSVWLNFTNWEFSFLAFQTTERTIILEGLPLKQR